VITGFNFLFFISILAAQFIALASFLELFAEFETRYIYYIAAIVVIIYTAVSGFKGVLLTDTYQFWIITFCVISITIIGYSQINLNSISELPNSYFNGLGYGASFIIGVFLFLPLSMLARSDLWQRIASSKDDQEVKKAFYVASPLIFIFYVLLTNLGIAAKAMGISVENPETSNLELFLNYGNTSGALDPTIFSVLVAIVSVGILSALVSTIDTNLNIISVAISKLFFKKSWNIERTDENPTETRNVLVRTGVISIILGILGIIFSMIVPDIVDLIVGAASIIMVFVPSIIGALFYKDKYPRLSVISIVGGLTSFIVLSIILQDPKISLLPGVLISFLIYFISRKFIKS
jgi:SSS family solute:Na+ symporter